MISLQTANNALKDVYLDVIANQINCNTDVLLGKIKHTSNDIWGKTIIKNVWINGKMLTFKEELKNFYVSMEISDKAIRCSQNSAGAFVNLLNDKVEYMIRESQHRLRNSFYTEDTKPDYLPEDFKYQPMEITGLKKIFDTKSKTLYGLSRKENPEMNPVIKTLDKFEPQTQEKAPTIREAMYYKLHGGRYDGRTIGSVKDEDPEYLQEILEKAPNSVAAKMIRMVLPPQQIDL